ncbi:MAG: twin-arginine translocase TatA/TatE family subunit [Phycisphaerae bacterium]
MSHNYLLAYFGDILNPVHLIIIMFFALLIWGKRLPEVAKSLGKSFGEFKKGLMESQHEIASMTAEKPLPPPQPPEQPASTVQQTPLDDPDKPA